MRSPGRGQSGDVGARRWCACNAWYILIGVDDPVVRIVVALAAGFAVAYILYWLTGHAVSAAIGVVVGAVVFVVGSRSS